MDAKKYYQVVKTVKTRDYRNHLTQIYVPQSVFFKFEDTTIIDDEEFAQFTAEQMNKRFNTNVYAIAIKWMA